jgi:hypothetical protein
MTQPEKTVTPDFIGFRIRLGTERQGSNEGEREREGNREANFHLSITSCIFSGRTVSFFLIALFNVTFIWKCFSYTPVLKHTSQ